MNILHVNSITLTRILCVRYSFWRFLTFQACFTIIVIPVKRHRNNNDGKASSKYQNMERPKTTYNHLQPTQKFQQRPTTTSKTSTATRINVLKMAKRHVTYMPCFRWFQIVCKWLQMFLRWLQVVIEIFEVVVDGCK